MRDGMRLGCLGFWLNCCLLASCLGLWLGGFARLGSLARGICQAWVSGSLGGHLDGAWVSGSVYLEKVPAFFEFAGTFFRAKPIETHNGSFYRRICLDAGTFSNRISYRPANKLTDTARNCLFPCFQHWFRTQQAYFTK